jgi:hypothetical protein
MVHGGGRGCVMFVVTSGEATGYNGQSPVAGLQVTTYGPTSTFTRGSLRLYLVLA